ncbi:hypothetical protein [Streptomyces sp. NPDC090021]
MISLPPEQRALRDQTLRMLNPGLTGQEIAERMQVPPMLKKAWRTHGCAC